MAEQVQNARFTLGVKHAGVQRPCSMRPARTGIRAHLLVGYGAAHIRRQLCGAALDRDVVIDLLIRGCTHGSQEGEMTKCFAAAMERGCREDREMPVRTEGRLQKDIRRALLSHFSTEWVQPGGLEPSGQAASCSATACMESSQAGKQEQAPDQQQLWPCPPTCSRFAARYHLKVAVQRVALRVIPGSRHRTGVRGMSACELQRRRPNAQCWAPMAAAAPLHAPPSVPDRSNDILGHTKSQAHKQ